MTTLTRRLTIVAAALLITLGPATLSTRAATGPENDSYVMNEGGTLVIDAPGLLANDQADSGTACVVGVDGEDLMGWLGEKGNTGWKTDGSFTFTPYEAWNGETTFVYGMRTLDDGGQCIGAADGQATVTITVRPVNEPPTAVIAGSCDGGVTVDQDSGPYNDPSHCAEVHNWGASLDENTQLVDEWIVSNDAPELFSEQPALDVVEITYGALHFEPAPGAHGSATVTVRARDTGGTANGGKDLSAPITFKIMIKASGTTSADPASTDASAPGGVETPASTDTSGGSATEAPTATPTQGPDEQPAGGPTGTAPWTLLLLVFVVLGVGAGIVVPRVLRRTRS
ncbi:MAG TPA: Ig-like domain-containing protein [Candidatus Limnocylindrales bacterium]|nr:Ig-like domain-containing protein [Candidatus Limnocylindrales bacterium]